MKSKFGLGLAGIYLTLSVYLIATQGLMGESFIALILGMPWTLGLAATEFGGLGGVAAQILLILPILLNAGILYFIGSRFGKKEDHNQS
ncbi:MAG: hypothetical protein ACYCY6_00075 [Minisyncoccota bacterium]